MTFYSPTADASDLYRDCASNASGVQNGTAVPGSLADVMKNAVLVEMTEEEFLAAISAPLIVDCNVPEA